MACTHSTTTGEHLHPDAVLMAFKVLSGTMKPKARDRAYNVLIGMANDLAPPPVDLAVVRLNRHRARIATPGAQAIGNALAKIADGYFSG